MRTVAAAGGFCLTAAGVDEELRKMIVATTATRAMIKLLESSDRSSRKAIVVVENGSEQSMPTQNTSSQRMRQ
eukprot:scaffold10764_cov159-Ochromonas_danica.AAC.49